jgi:hypothetical protein
MTIDDDDEYDLNRISVVKVDIVLGPREVHVVLHPFQGRAYSICLAHIVYLCKGSHGM